MLKLIVGTLFKVDYSGFTEYVFLEDSFKPFYSYAVIC